MSDQDFLDEEPGTGGSPEPKKGGGINILKILMFVGIGIGVIALIIVISFLVSNLVLSQNGQPSQQTPISEDYIEVPEKYAYTEVIADIKTRTLDKANVVIKITLGFKEDDKQTPEEVNMRKFQIQDYLRNYFAQKKASELEPQDEAVLKQELRAKLNDMMTSKEIKSVLFTRFDVIPE